LLKANNPVQQVRLGNQFKTSTLKRKEARVEESSFHKLQKRLFQFKKLSLPGIKSNEDGLEKTLRKIEQPSNDESIVLLEM